MKVKFKNNGETKKMMGIIGLPASGTSIIAKMFHSIDNSVCIMEAFHTDYIKKLNSNGLDKLGKIPSSNKDNLITNIKKHIESTKFDLVTFKEVQITTDRNKRWEYLLENNNIDYFLFIYREPKSCWSSWKKKEFRRAGLDGFILTYKTMDKHRKRLEDMGKKVFIIKYEDIVKPNILTKTFKEEMEFEGELKLKQINGFMPPMNPKAKVTTKLNKPNTNIDNLSLLEKKKINSTLSQIYGEL